MGKVNEFRVLVATDGSSHAGRAMATAMQCPWPSRTRVRAVVARRMDRAHGGAILLAALDRGADFVARAAGRRLARRWPDADAVVVDEPPTEAVLGEAARFGADVIVLGWRGHGPLRRLLMGSVSRGVIRGARCAVLVVRRRSRDVRRVVVGVDGSSNARRAVAFLGKLHAPPGGSITLIMAVEQMALPTQALATSGIRAAVAAEARRLNQARVAAAKERLAAIAAKIRRRGWRVRVVVRAGAPLRDILTTVTETKADLVVVGARGIGGVRRLLLGSVAEGLLNGCPVPVLVVR